MARRIETKRMTTITRRDWAEKLLKSKEFGQTVNAVCIVVLIAFIAYIAFIGGMATMIIGLLTSPNGCLFNCVIFGEGNTDLCYDACVEVEEGFHEAGNN